MDPARWRRARWSACGLGDASWAQSSAQAVGRFGAMQAQEFEFTLWSLSQRTGQTHEQVLAEYAKGDFVRTHAIRQTWHFVRREDLATIQAATADRVHLANAGMFRDLGLDAETLADWRAWLTDALAAGPKTRALLRRELIESGRPMEGLMLGLALMWAELEMVIANGPLHGKSQTYRLLDPQQLPDRSASIAWLVRTFLSSHGPSTVADIAAWSSLKRSDIKTALEQLDPDSDEGPTGTCYWFGALQPDEPPAALLNGYDEYISGLVAASKRYLDPGDLQPGRVGTPIHCVLSDGLLAGFWRRVPEKARIRLEIVPVRRLDDSDRTNLAAQVERFAAFAGVPVESHEVPLP